MNPRHRTILLLRCLQQLEPVDDSSFFRFLDHYSLNGRGLSFVDVHLLAAVSQLKGAKLWSHDRRMREQAERLGLAYQT
ncbi:MAG TPA: hypothetical protein DER67_08205 [Novosphingobium sp.]|nr:hypothetical protein [Novosphingobium sp.]